MGGHNGRGSLGTDRNTPVIDSGTLVRSRSRVHRPIGLAGSYINYEEIKKTLIYMGSRQRAALKKMGSQLPKISRPYRKKYETDGNKLKLAGMRVLAVYWDLCGGWSHDTGKFDRYYDEWCKRLILLELANEKWEALIRAWGIGFAAYFLLLSRASFKELKKECEELPPLLEKLKKELKKAQREVTEAEVQRVINVTLTVTSLALGPVGAIRTLLVRSAVFTGGSMAADAMLGPDKFNALASLNTELGNAIGSYEKLSSVTQNFASAASGLITLKFDTDEIGHAEAIVRRLRGLTEAVSKRLRWAQELMKRSLPELKKLNRSLPKVISAYKEATREATEADRDYQNLYRTLPRKQTWK